MKIILYILLAQFIFAHSITYEEFLSKIYQNSPQIIMSEAESKSLQSQREAMIAWDYPSVEISPSTYFRNKNNTQAQILLMITPKMPWVRNAIKDSYAIKDLKNQNQLSLQKSLLSIGAKREYLQYLIALEQLEIYQTKQDLARQAYNTALKQFQALRISKAELLRFKNDKSNAISALHNHYIKLKEKLNTLRMISGDSEFETISNLGFYYVNDNINITKLANDSIYNEILKLDGEDYGASAKVAQSSIMEGMQFGAGYTSGQNSLDFKMIIPLPITPKASHEKQALLELQSANTHSLQISKQRIEQSAIFYKTQLQNIQNNINEQTNNQNDMEELFNIIQKGFSMGAISVFEYISTKNSYLDSKIKTTELKLDYISTLALLEESIGETILGNK